MRIVTFTLALMVAFAGGPIQADDAPLVVVELFTSQGCSSCPPADELMVDLARRSDVIGLALHVDYWDYIGWKDEYGDPAHTKRQKGYAHVAGRKMVYTPQMIVNGQEDVVGAHAMELAELIDRHKNIASGVSVTVAREDGSVVVGVKAVGDVAGEGGPYDVYLVRYTPMRRAHITRGELAGHDLDYANIVDGWSVLGQWDGQAATEFRDEIGGDRPVVILVQKPGYGAILAAARAE